MGLFDRLPGVDGGNPTRRNVIVAAIYMLSGLAVLDGVIGGFDDERSKDEETTTDPEPETDPQPEPEPGTDEEETV